MFSKAHVESMSPEQRRAALAGLLKDRAADICACPLSSGQHRIWFLQQLEPQSTAFNIPLIFRLGPVRPEILQQSLEIIVHRQEGLRTCFRADQGEPRQEVRPAVVPPLPIRTLEGVVEGDGSEQLQQLSRLQARQPIDLENGPLYRGELVRLAPDRHALLLTIHHIVLDGWSVGVLLRELSEVYFALAEGRSSPLASLPARFSDFVRWQQSKLQGERLGAELRYWQQQLAGAPWVLELPTDRPRPAVRSFRGATHHFSLSESLTQELKALSRRQGATLFMTLLASFYVLLYRLSGQRDIVLGTVVANRERKEFWDLLGMFANTLPVRTDLSGDPPFARFLQQIRSRALEDYAHADLPLEKLVEALRPPRDPSRNPLFQVCFVFQNSPWPTTVRQDLPLIDYVSLVNGDNGAAKFDLTMTVQDDPGGLNGALEYSTDLYDAATARRLGLAWQALLRAVVADPEASVARLPLQSAEETARLVSVVSAGETAEYRPVSVPARIAAQAARQPSTAAVVGRAGSLSYAELEAGANRLARLLRARGVGPETRVAVCLPRTPQLVQALLAVMKAGGCYLPLDPAYPGARLRWMSEDGGAPLLLTCRALRGALPEGLPAPAVLEDLAPALAAQSDEELERAPGWSMANLAYVLYSSGSTGRPKGIGIEHRSLSALVGWAGDLYRGEELGGVLAGTSVSWDLSAFELWVTLSLGGTVILAENLLELPSVPEQARVRLLNTVPSVMAELLALAPLPPGIKTVNLAGEPVPSRLVEALYERGIDRVFNLYGPTEDTTYSTFSRLTAGEPPTIGRPLSNSQVHVLDRWLQPTPVGIVGEIYIAGSGLARGYLGRPDLTAERFLPDPFGASGGRLYRTGDLGRYREDGRLEFLGRRDHQVKVRGHRIELGEVEEALRQHPAVAQAAVLAVDDPRAGRQLVAYVVPPPDRRDLAVEELRAHLLARLPMFMLPAGFVLLPELPLLPNQKVDRQALAALPPDPDRSSRLYQPPRDELEQALASTWQELLGVERVGAFDDFFALGGHSLMVPRLLARLREGCGIDLPLRSLFESPTVAGLAEAVRLRRWADALLPRPGATGTEEEVEL